MNRRKFCGVSLLSLFGLATKVAPAEAHTIKKYTTYTTYDLYVERWYRTRTRTEYFYDRYGRRWTLLEDTYDVAPKYEYVGSVTVKQTVTYQRLCGRIRWSAATGHYYYECACGRVFYCEE